MPVYLFTYHAYGSWMPDHKRGYTRKNAGVFSTNHELVNRYQENQSEHLIVLDRSIQEVVVDEVQLAADHQRFKIYIISTDPTHIHVLCGWDDERPWDKIRNGIRSSITRRLNQTFTRRRWLAENASRKHVKDEAHFNHLRANYLPGHRGLKWQPDRGTFE